MVTFMQVADPWEDAAGRAWLAKMRDSDAGGANFFSKDCLRTGRAKM